jgi:hypothetical protein
LAEDEKDEVGQILSHLALANIYELPLKNPELATQHLQATIILATKLGDRDTSDMAQTRKARLPK